MDNLTHTLVGAALAESGLKRRTALGAATLMIGANFPDIDVVAVPLGRNFEWRRGATHGFLALLVLPFVLAGIMLLYDSYVRRRRNPAAAPADYRQLVVLSGVSMLTHPALDFMNSYGMRWLMPFVDKWFYADGLFIVDPWVLGALILGVVWSRRDGNPTPARLSLAGIGLYVVAMLTVTTMGRNAVWRAYPYRRFMVAPTAVVPWKREVVIAEDSVYRFGRYSVLDGLDVGAATIAKWETPRAREAFERARRAPEAQPFLRWARFPAYQIRTEGADTVIRIVDARYCCGGWASVEVRLP